jgi:hypothetical protein
MIKIRTNDINITSESFEVGGYILRFYIKKYKSDYVWILRICNNYRELDIYSPSYFNDFHIPYINTWIEEMYLKYA